MNNITKKYCKVDLIIDICYEKGYWGGTVSKGGAGRNKDKATAGEVHSNVFEGVWTKSCRVGRVAGVGHED